MGKRPKVARPVLLPQACQDESRNRVVQVDFDKKKSFVVAEADVVARLKILDELAFQQQCLGFAARDFACFGFCQPQCGLRRGFAGVSPVNGVSSIPGIMTVKGICRRSSKARR